MKIVKDEELKKYGLPKELTKQEVLDIAIMRYELSTNSFQRTGPFRSEPDGKNHS